MNRYDLARAVARDAGKLAHRAFGVSATKMKGRHDVVTEMDREVERFLTDRLAALFPDDGIFGEEGAARPGRSGRTWVLDPIDGTFNFVRGTDCWVVSIGLYAGGAPAFGAGARCAERRSDSTTPRSWTLVPEGPAGASWPARRAATIQSRSVMTSR